ncbi:MAG: hypothetical protein ACRD3T_16355 [Terriglobia bacterium]
MTDAGRALIKYVFVDVVKYTEGRSVEAQSDIVGTLNNLVTASTSEVGLSLGDRIFLPTGDGICIALIRPDLPYEVPLDLALIILRRLEEYNFGTHDATRQFRIRIGLNANVDNFISDINGQRNVAGAGINLAQRIMSCADENQIMLGDALHGVLAPRERYRNAFEHFVYLAKHEEKLNVHQFVQGRQGLNTSQPSRFATPVRRERSLTKFVAYYFAHLIRNREFLKRVMARSTEKERYSSLVLFVQLARDSEGASDATDIKRYRPHTWGAGSKNIEEQFNYYNSIDHWVLYDLAWSLMTKYLSNYRRCFESGGEGFLNHFVSPTGRQRLRAEWPAIWNEFGLELYGQQQG